MRLDLFLKVSRLIARRSLAQEFCDEGLICVNGAPAKSSKDVRATDEIEIRRGDRVTKVRVIQIPSKKQIAKSDASSLYEIIGQSQAGGPPLS
jgi:ribosomal 50S subunit-recycling heat shock protein